ncbi:hypothetical protein [Luteolibacter luteus]|uniref:Uncharacterized protein n=1 Tax=Luteolibacter luteus TaxID=2728835 RepID=A0A858RIZ6_9BACT|nr:hypothetical protein [Luteolibacter luteus]QJE96190.1 hypothetical protein HHL09_10465 [Luteolibacter luteus]
MKLDSPKMLLLCAAMFPALPVQATPEKNYVNPFIGGQFQLSEEINPTSSLDKIVAKVQTVKLNGKDLLQLISEATETEFPKGARLLVDLSGIKAAGVAPLGGTTIATTWVVDRDGTPLLNATEFLLFTFDFNSLIYSGLVDFLNNKEKTKNQFPATLRMVFSHRDIDVFFQGNCFENFRMSSPNSQGVQHVHGVTRFAADGHGFFNDELFVGSTDIILRGDEDILID